MYLSCLPLPPPPLPIFSTSSAAILLFISLLLLPPPPHPPTPSTFLVRCHFHSHASFLSCFRGRSLLSHFRFGRLYRGPRVLVRFSRREPIICPTSVIRSTIRTDVLIVASTNVPLMVERFDSGARSRDFLYIFSLGGWGGGGGAGGSIGRLGRRLLRS